MAALMYFSYSDISIFGILVLIEEQKPPGGDFCCEA
jgi:hypothetical protein